VKDKRKKSDKVLAKTVKACSLSGIVSVKDVGAVSQFTVTHVQIVASSAPLFRRRRRTSCLLRCWVVQYSTWKLLSGRREAILLNSPETVVSPGTLPPARQRQTGTTARHWSHTGNDGRPARTRYSRRG